MKNFNENLYKAGDKVIFALASNFRQSFVGMVISAPLTNIEYTIYVYNKQLKEALPITKYVTKEEIYAIAPYNEHYKSEFDHILMHEHILKLAQEYEQSYAEKNELYEFNDIKTDIIMHTSYQRFLFEEKYYDKTHLNHVVFFAPEASYYPNGHYKLNDKPITDESDAIGEMVEHAWQSWRHALLYNKWLNNIKPIEVTYKGL